MPANYKKPDSNASNHEVTEFLTNKYVHKKWANTDDWNNDPAWLFENKPKKFQKYLNYYQESFGGKPAPEKVSYKNKRSDSSDDENAKEAPKPATKVGLGAPPSNNSR